MKDLHSLSNCWRTPRELFDGLNKEYKFTHDLCADKDNHLCDNWFEDYLTSEFKEGVGYCNPPYSNPRPFIEKAWRDSLHCKIVALVKCDPSTQWWAMFWDYGTEILDVKFDGKQHHFDGHSTKMYYGPKPGCEVLFFPKRIKFDPPQQLIESGEVFDIQECPDCVNLGYKNPYTKDFYELPEICEHKNKKPKWVQKCKECELVENGVHKKYYGDYLKTCEKCKGKGYTSLSGPSFGCALLIFDRRNV